VPMFGIHSFPSHAVISRLRQSIFVRYSFFSGYVMMRATKIICFGSLGHRNDRDYLFPSYVVVRRLHWILLIMAMDYCAHMLFLIKSLILVVWRMDMSQERLHFHQIQCLFAATVLYFSLNPFL
jgi:hypothetical protein